MFLIFTKKNLVVTMGAILLLLLVLYAGIHISSVAMHNAVSNSGNYKDEWSEHFAEFEPVANGYSVLVDLDYMTLYLYEDGLEFKEWPVSGGSKENPSPVGNWEVTTIENWASGFGGSWIGINVPWGDYGIHGTVEPWAIGNSNISHGCIRMNNDDVAALKAYMSVGVPVHIKHDTAPFRVLRDGDVGSDVLLLQMMLMQLDYYNNGIDGVFSRGTFEAVCQFQSDENITVDGIGGYDTWSRLKEYTENLQ